MSTPDTKLARVPRASLSTRIEALAMPNAKGYADFIRVGDVGAPIPCWGAIATRFVESFTADDERLALLDTLIAEGDRRPLYLFLHTSKDRPALLAALCDRAAELPLPVQRNLVAMPEAAVFVDAELDRFDPAARTVWEAGEESKRSEQELLASRVGELMSFQYFVPDSFDPHDEPPAKRAQALAAGERVLSAGSEAAFVLDQPALDAAVPPILAGNGGDPP